MKKIKITLDSCILFDYLREDRKFHRNAKNIIDSNKYKLFITETVIKEIRDKDQLSKINKLIKSKIIYLLKEPRIGTPIPTTVPMDLSHISVRRDNFIEDQLTKRPGLKKYKIIKDFLIVEAHFRNGNDYMLTNNIRDFCANSDCKIITYDYFAEKE